MADSHLYTGFVGIDVSAKTFTATWTPGGPPRPQTFDQTPDGYQSFLAQLQTSTLTPAASLMVMEATGCYWVTLAVTLHQAGYHVAVMNPMHTTNFARSLPRRAKTDALDADLLLAFARERRPTPWTPPPVVYHELRQRLLARDALMEMRQQARNQRHALDQWPVQIAAVSAQFNEIIADFDARIAHLDQEIAHNLQHGAWATSATLLASIPGLGPTTCAWLLVATINFTVAETPQSLAAYAGLAPMDRQSGTSVRGQSRIGHGGHRRLRKALYLATLTAARHNPIIRPFYTRLREAGKPFKVAQCAAARKLLMIAWAVVTKQCRFDPRYGVTNP